MLLKNKVEIETWLRKYEVTKYDLIPDEEYGYVVNVKDNVYLTGLNLKSIDVKFNIVKGNFICNDNQLMSLEGCPELISRNLFCSNNQITSLKNCPKIINGNLYLNNNNLNINEIINLINLEIKNNYIELNNNKDLGDLQNKSNFNEIKKILTIYKEKADFMRSIVADKSAVESINKSKSNDFIRTVEIANRLVKVMKI